MSDGQSEWHDVGSVDEFETGKMAAFKIDDQLIAVYKLDDGYYATSNICTHAFALLSDGWLDDEVVECPLHGGQFDVRTGKALGDPVTIDLQTFETRVVEDRVQVFVALNAVQDIT